MSIETTCRFCGTEFDMRHDACPGCGSKGNFNREEEIKRGYRLPDANLDIPMPKVSAPRQEGDPTLGFFNYQGYTIRGKPGEPGCTLYIDDEAFKDLPEQVLNLLLITSKERDYYRDMIKRLECDPAFT